MNNSKRGYWSKTYFILFIALSLELMDKSSYAETPFKSEEENKINSTKISLHQKDSIPQKRINNSLEKVSIKAFDSQIVQYPDWTNQHLTNHYYPFDGKLFPLRDLNGDGFDDIGFISEYQRRQFLYIFLGGESGLKNDPDWTLEVGDSTQQRGSFELITVTSAGDLNNDGYDDIFVIGHYPDYRITDKPLLLLGGQNELTITTIDLPADSDKYDAWVYPYPLGDVNGDGINDVLLMYDFPFFSGVVVYGGNNGDLHLSNWPDPDYADYERDGSPVVCVGDFNGDGFSDVLVNKLLFHGSATGFNLNPDKILEINLTGSFGFYYQPVVGDFNGDGFDDIITARSLEVERDKKDKNTINIIPGSPNSLDTSNQFILREWFDLPNSLPDYSYLGDVNNDGYDDFSSSETIYFGAAIDFTPENNSRFINFNTAIFRSPDIWRDLVYVGDLNNDGSDDFYKRMHQAAIYYSPTFEPPSVSCPDTLEFCYKGPDATYDVPLFEISNSHFIDFNINFTDSTGNIPIESRRDLNASGQLINGQLIRLSAYGYNQVVYGCETKVKLRNSIITPVSIKANSAHPKGDPNTLYIGYGATAFRIEAIPAGGGGPYTYLWSNGSTEKNPRISESVPGEYPYWVKMKNVHGCESADTAIIKVENALCSSPLVDVVMSQYPTILQNPLLANLIKSNSKIAVCKDGQTMCFTKAVVDIRIERAGYTIGACTPGVIPAEAFMTDEMEEILRGGLKVIVAPNPSSHAFQLNVVSIYNAPVVIRIMDLAGRQVEVLNNAASNQTIMVGHKLRAGTYIAEVISGKERMVVKLVKMQ